MTYKTLRRKSDGQWMRADDELREVIPTNNPDIWSFPNLDIELLTHGREQWCDWSLYELIEVVVIPVDRFPSDEDVWKEINARIPDEYYAQETGKIINRYKSQILKP